MTELLDQLDDRQPPFVDQQRGERVAEVLRTRYAIPIASAPGAKTRLRWFRQPSSCQIPPMAVVGSSGRNAAQVATSATRRAKDQSLTPEQLLGEWRARAVRAGRHRVA